MDPITLDRRCWSWSLLVYSQQDSRQSSKIKSDGESHPMDTARKMLLTVLLINDIATGPLFLLKKEEAASVNFIGRATIPADMKVVAYNSRFRFTNPFLPVGLLRQGSWPYQEGRCRLRSQLAEQGHCQHHVPGSCWR